MKIFRTMGMAVATLVVSYAGIVQASSPGSSGCDNWQQVVDQVFQSPDAVQVTDRISDWPVSFTEESVDQIANAELDLKMPIVPANVDLDTNDQAWIQTADSGQFDEGTDFWNPRVADTGQDGIIQKRPGEKDDDSWQTSLASAGVNPDANLGNDGLAESVLGSGVTFGIGGSADADLAWVSGVYVS